MAMATPLLKSESACILRKRMHFARFNFSAQILEWFGSRCQGFGKCGGEVCRHDQGGHRVDGLVGCFPAASFAVVHPVAVGAGEGMACGLSQDVWSLTVLNRDRNSFIKGMKPRLDHAQLPQTWWHFSITRFPKLPGSQADMQHFSHLFLGVTRRNSGVFDDLRRRR